MVTAALDIPSLRASSDLVAYTCPLNNQFPGPRCRISTRCAVGSNTASGGGSALPKWPHSVNLTSMSQLLQIIAGSLPAVLRGCADLTIENISLHQQVAVLKGKRPGPRLSSSDRSLSGAAPSVLVRLGERAAYRPACNRRAMAPGRFPVLARAGPAGPHPTQYAESPGSGAQIDLKGKPAAAMSHRLTTVERGAN